MSTSVRRNPAFRIAVWTGRGLAMVLLLVLTTLVGVLIALHLPSGRAYATQQINSFLKEGFVGRLEIESFRRVGLSGIEGVHLRLFDARGQRVAHGAEARVEIDLPLLLWGLAGSGPLQIRIPQIRLVHAELRLIDDGNGLPTFIAAFNPRTPTPAPLASQPARATRVELEQIRLDHVWVHGQVGSVPAIDVDVRALRGSLSVAEEHTAVRIDDLNLTARAVPLVENATGQLAFRLAISTPTKTGRVARNDQDLVGSLTFNGFLAEPLTSHKDRSPVQLNAELRGESLVATAKIAPIGHSLLQRLAPRMRLAQDSELTLRAEGTLPVLNVRAVLLSGAASVRVAGHLESLEPLKGKLEIAGRSVDSATVDPDAPSSRLNFYLESSLLSNQEHFQANYSIAIFDSEVSTILLPPTTARGSLKFGFNARTLAINGALLLDEPGAPTSVQFGFQAPQGTLSLSARSVLARPPRLALLVPGLAANGTVDVMGSVNIDQKALLLEANAQLARVVLTGGSTGQTHSIERASVRAKAQGAFANPNLRAFLQADQIEALGQHLAHARVQVIGTPRALSVLAKVAAVDGRTVHAGSQVAFTEGTELRQLRVAYTDKNLALTGRAARIKIGQGRVLVDKAELLGAGELRLSGVFSNSLERLELETKQLDLALLLNTFTGERRLLAARADLSATYESRRTGPTGSVRGSISRINVDRVQNGSIQLGIELESGLLSGPIEAKLGEGGSLNANLEHVGPISQLIERGDIRDLRGSLQADGRLSLTRLLELLGPDALPLDTAHGTLHFDLDAVADKLGVPTLQVRVRTEKLGLVGKRVNGEKIVTAAEARKAQPWAIQGIDLDVNLSGNGTDHPKLLGRLFDSRGDLATFEILAPGTLPLAGETQEWLRDLRTLPWEARLRVPRRDLEQLPGLLKLPGWGGVVSGNLEARGTLLSPEVSLSASAENVKPSAFGAKKTTISPLRVKLDGNYQAHHGALRIEARSQDNAHAKAVAEWEGSPVAMSQIGQSETSPITGNMKLELDDFSVDIIPALRARGLSGRLSGHAELKDFGRAAALSAKIQTPRFKIGDAKELSLSGTLTQQGNTLLAKVSLGQPSGTSLLSFRSGIIWGNRLVPEITEPMSADVDLRNLDLMAFQPLVIDQVTDLGGTLDAQIHIDLAETRSIARGWIRLKDGSVSVPTVGQRLDNIDANIALTPGRVLLRELTAHGTSGKLSAGGYATFTGVQPTYAELAVSIKKNEKIPVTVESMTVGDVWGRVSLRYQPGKGDENSVLDVQVPKMHLELAATPPNSVQSLEPAEGVRIGIAFPDRFVTLPLQPLLHEANAAPSTSKTVIRVALGDDVTITKGTDLEAKLSGMLEVQSEPKTTIAGQIQLLGGILDVSGKQFQIERGTVTFRPNEDPANPTIVATARWDSPAEYSVFAEYRGPVENGKLTLRSEPPLAEDQILTLILFGTPDGNVGSAGGASDASAAAGLVAGTATKGLNRALSKVSNLDVSTRVDTSSGASRPELVVQISPRVAARVTRALAEPTAGQSPDRTFLTLDFRLFLKWSLAAQVGDQGASSLDLVWRHRY